MKRDLDLCLEILREFEKQPPGGFQVQYDSPEAIEHISLMVDEGLITGHVFPGQPHPGGTALINKITWEGHDFLGAAKDQTIVAAAIKRLKKVGGWTFSLLLEVLKDEAKQRLGLALPE